MSLKWESWSGPFPRGHHWSLNDFCGFHVRLIENEKALWLCENIHAWHRWGAHIVYSACTSVDRLTGRTASDICLAAGDRFNHHFISEHLSPWLTSPSHGFTWDWYMMCGVIFYTSNKEGESERDGGGVVIGKSGQTARSALLNAHKHNIFPERHSSDSWATICITNIPEWECMHGE